MSRDRGHSPRGQGAGTTLRVGPLDVLTAGSHCQFVAGPVAASPDDVDRTLAAVAGAGTRWRGGG
ncbi:hypothetical protein P0W64_21850, partial [Tsukamurella sp. 8F]